MADDQKLQQAEFNQSVAKFFVSLEGPARHKVPVELKREQSHPNNEYRAKMQEFEAAMTPSQLREWEKIKDTFEGNKKLKYDSHDIVGAIKSLPKASASAPVTGEQVSEVTMRDNNVILETARKMSRMEGGTRFSADAMAAGQSLIQLVGGPEKMHGLVEKYMQDEANFIKDLSPADRKSFLDVGRNWGHTDMSHEAEIFRQQGVIDPPRERLKLEGPDRESFLEKFLRKDSDEVRLEGRIDPKDRLSAEDKFKDLMEKFRGEGPLRIIGLQGNPADLERELNNLAKEMNLQIGPVEHGGQLLEQSVGAGNEIVRGLNNVSDYKPK